MLIADNKMGDYVPFDILASLYLGIEETKTFSEKKNILCK